MLSIIRKYTFHDTMYCTKINLLLASDSIELESHANYISKLQRSIIKIAAKNPIKIKKCFRGMQMSLLEYDSYSLNEIIYIPSFLSTSKNQKKFYNSNNNNALLIINLNYQPNNAIEINKNLSLYFQQEEEILFGCYSKFKVIKKEKNFSYCDKIFEYYLCLEHINECLQLFDTKNILMLNFLGF